MSYIGVQLYAYVTVTYVYECHMSNLTRVQTIRNLHIYKIAKKIDTVGLCRPDVAIDQVLHCLSLILSHIFLGGVKPYQIIWVYTALMLRILFFFCFS